jgi:3-hydroxybutyryl-CoA dehydrogenase
VTETAGTRPSSASSNGIHTVAVIGAGIAGRSFALACVAAGFHVVLEDVMPAKLRRAEADFSDLSLHKTVGRLGGVAGSMDLVSTVEDAVREADIAVDFVPDELESKLEIFSMIDRMAPPKTILCTPSDALSITDLASCVYRPERCVAVHGGFVHGTAAMQGMVQVVYPAMVADATLDAVKEFFLVLDFEVRMEPDPNPPMLVKNAARGDVLS